MVEHQLKYMEMQGNWYYRALSNCVSTDMVARGEVVGLKAGFI